MKEALGIVEVQGLVFAVACADAALKAANVELLGYESSKGGAQFVLKFVGNIGSVKAAIDSAVALAKKNNKDVVGYAIPRPSGVCWEVVNSEEKLESIEAVERAEDEDKEIKESKPEIEEITEESEPEIEEITEEHEPEIEKEEVTEEAEPRIEEGESKLGICNLCGDSKCPRRKNEPHSLCIHFYDNK